MKYLRRNIIILALLLTSMSVAIQADTIQSGPKLRETRRKLSSKSSKSGGKSGKSESTGHKNSHIIYLDGNEASKHNTVYIFEEERSKGKSGKSSGEGKYLRLVVKTPLNSTNANSTNSSGVSGSTKSLLSSSLTVSSPASIGDSSWVGISLVASILGTLFL